MKIISTLKLASVLGILLFLLLVGCQQPANPDGENLLPNENSKLPYDDPEFTGKIGREV